MSTKTEVEMQHIKSSEDIAARDRQQRDKAAKINAAASLAGGVIGALSKIKAAKIKAGPAMDYLKWRSDFPASRFGDNDSSWYKQIPGLTTPNTMIPDFQVLGQADTLVRPSFTGVPLIYKFNYAPTIGQTIFDFSAGIVGNKPVGTDPFNRSLNRVATQLENRNSRVLSYSRDTIGRYLFIVTDLAQDIIRLRIAIEWFDSAQGDKPFLGRQMIRALGFNYTDFRNNIADYKAAYVSVAHDFNEGLPLPKDLSYVARKDYLSRLVVADSSGEYSALMIMNKCVDFNFIEGNAGISVDNYVSTMQPQTGYVFNNYINNIRNRIHLLVNGNTWKPLIRDLRGSTKSNMWYRLPDTVDGVFSIITVSSEIRNQLHNMDMQPCLPEPSGAKSVVTEGMIASSFSIGGDTSESVRQGYVHGTSNTLIGTGSDFANAYIANQPGVILIQTSTAAEATSIYNQFGAMYNCNAKLLDKFAPVQIYNQYDEYTPDSIIVGTRLKSVWGSRVLSVGTSHIAVSLTFDNATHNLSNYTLSANADAHVVAIFPMVYGTELALNCQVIIDQPDNATFTFGSSLYVGSRGFKIYGSTPDTYVVEFSNYQLSSTMISGFGVQFPAVSAVHTSLLTILDWCPILHVYSENAGSYDISGKGWTVISELDHYIALDGQVLKRLHEQAVESETNVPESNYLKPLQ